MSAHRIFHHRRDVAPGLEADTRDTLRRRASERAPIPVQPARQQSIPDDLIHIPRDEDAPIPLDSERYHGTNPAPYGTNFAQTDSTQLPHSNPVQIPHESMPRQSAYISPMSPPLSEANYFSQTDPGEPPRYEVQDPRLSTASVQSASSWPHSPYTTAQSAHGSAQSSTSPPRSPSPTPSYQTIDPRSVGSRSSIGSSSSAGCHLPPLEIVASTQTLPPHLAQHPRAAKLVPAPRTPEMHQKWVKVVTEGKRLNIQKMLHRYIMPSDWLDEAMFIALRARPVSLETMGLLAVYDGNCDARNAAGDTLLHLAISSSNVETARWLVLRGVDVHARDASNNTTIHLAVRDTRPQDLIVELLLQHGVDVNAVNQSGDQALHLSLRRKDATFFRLLLHQRATVRYPDEEGNTALHLAVAHPEGATCVRLLFEQDPDWARDMVRRHNKRGLTPLCLLVQSKSTDALAELKMQGYARTSNGPEQLEAFTIAIQMSEVEMVVTMLSWQWSPPDDALFHAFAACGSGGLKGERARHIFSHLFTMNPWLANNRDLHGRSILHVAAAPSSAGQEYALKRLLVPGARLNLQDDDMRTPLHHAVVADNVATVTMLLAATTASLNIPDKDGQTALQLAGALNRQALIPLLVGAGARV